MITSVDTNILVALWDEDNTLHLAAQRVLDEAQARGQLVICGAVYAELLAAPGRDASFVDQFCEDTRVGVEWEVEEKMWRAAGGGFQSYALRRRREKGMQPRRILADFLIGAHAWVNGYRLLTLDGRMYRASFPRLVIVEL